MKLEEKIRFDRQIETEQQKLIIISQKYLELQALFIDLFDSILMRQY